MDDPDSQLFDLIAIYVGPEQEADRIVCPKASCPLVYRALGTRWGLVKELILSKDWPEIQRSYDRFMFLAHDAVVGTGAINRAFLLHRTKNLKLGAMSLCNSPSGIFGEAMINMQQPSLALRFTSFTNLVAPIFTREAVEKALRPSLRLEEPPVTGRGLEVAWPYLLNYEKSRIGIIDASCAAERRPTITRSLIRPAAAMATVAKSVRGKNVKPPVPNYFFNATRETILVMGALSINKETQKAKGVSDPRTTVYGKVSNAEVDFPSLFRAAGIGTATLPTAAGIAETLGANVTVVGANPVVSEAAVVSAALGGEWVPSTIAQEEAATRILAASNAAGSKAVIAAAGVMGVIAGCIITTILSGSPRNAGGASRFSGLWRRLCCRVRARRFRHPTPPLSEAGSDVEEGFAQDGADDEFYEEMDEEEDDETSPLNETGPPAVLARSGRAASTGIVTARGAGAAGAAGTQGAARPRTAANVELSEAAASTDRVLAAITARLANPPGARRGGAGERAWNPRQAGGASGHRREH